MKILVIGQCTLQWGRMEFGNIGNYYIIEPFFRLLHETFPGCEISTTFQLSERFCVSENVSVVPMDLYYSWENDLQQAENEFRLAQRFLKDGKIDQTTPYIDLVRSMDLVVDFSGDIWGDNADFLGENRFYVGLLKDRVAQIFAGKTAMIAGSPGPFSEGKNLEFAKEVFKNFDLVTNRENISISVLKSYGFDVSKTYSLTCPAFRFKPAPIETIKKFDKIDKLISENKPSVGFLLCGWNFSEGPFDRWPRNDSEYEVFVSAIERFCVKTGADIYLMSHSNGFPIPPKSLV